MRSLLSGALRRQELGVAYQPIVALDTERVIGFEALARWNSAELGSVPPADFVPLAERSGDIVQIGDWVLRTACAQIARWRTAEPALSISVNLAPVQLGVPNLATVVESVLAEQDLPPSALTLEITESVLIDAGDIQSRNLARLSDLGVQIALDDFGTGYSALGYLKRFSVDTLKIDRSFMTGPRAQPEGTLLIEAILTVARGLNMTVVAEGIETESQRELLLSLGCRLGQGYLFAPPRAPDEITSGPDG